jgi:hypothetical protein
LKENEARAAPRMACEAIDSRRPGAGPDAPTGVAAYHCLRARQRRYELLASQGLQRETGFSNGARPSDGSW